MKNQTEFKKIFKKMHLDIKKMKTVSSQALDFGLQIFIDQVSGEKENSKIYNFMCSENFFYILCASGNVKSFSSRQIIKSAVKIP